MPSRAGAISGIGVSVSPNQRKTLTRPTSSDVPGTISTTTQRPTRNTRERRGSRAMANPAQEATTTETGTATAATSSEFAMYRPNGTTSKTSA